MQVSGVRAVGRVDGSGQVLTGARAPGGLGTGAGANPFVLSAEAFQARGGTDESQTERAPLPGGGAWAEVSLAPGTRAGMVHVSVAYHSSLDMDSGAGETIPTVALQAEVRATWLRNVGREAATRGEQAAKIAQALASVAAIPGQSTVSVSGADQASEGLPTTVLLGGALHPLTPTVWLPAEYPPPPDDPYLAAQVREPAA